MSKRPARLWWNTASPMRHMRQSRSRRCRKVPSSSGCSANTRSFVIRRGRAGESMGIIWTSVSPCSGDPLRGGKPTCGVAAQEPQHANIAFVRSRLRNLVGGFINNAHANHHTLQTLVEGRGAHAMLTA